jgi:N-acetyl-gamma-glutamyl-phosphate reductase
MTAKLKTALLGATGYSGMELTRILARHPHVQYPRLFRRQVENGIKKESDSHAFSSNGNGTHVAEPFSWEALKAHGVELLFLATPHDVSRMLVPEALARGLRVVDLSGAWRLKEPANRAIYGFQDADAHATRTTEEKAVYGLPELHAEEIRDAALVANPGCYATSVILALAPLLAADVVDRKRGVISDSKSGVSGAGKEPTARTHFVSVADNFSAYGVFKHRHVGEVLEQAGLKSSEFIFTPHLLPIPRGILSTLYVALKRPSQSEEIQEFFRAFYEGKRWVRVQASPHLPEIQGSLHTNYCDLGFCLDEDGKRLVLISCLDNLLKGAAGQAVQNMNLMYGWAEEAGLA